MSSYPMFTAARGARYTGDVESDFGLSFTVTGPDGQEKELVPGGANIPVTAANRVRSPAAAAEDGRQGVGVCCRSCVALLPTNTTASCRPSPHLEIENRCQKFLFSLGVAVQRIRMVAVGRNFEF